jgi:hypothetical protein
MSDKIVKFRDKSKSDLKAYVVFLFRRYANKSGMSLEDLLVTMWEQSLFPKELLHRSELSKIYLDHKDDIDRLSGYISKIEPFRDPCQKVFVSIILCLADISLGFGIFPSDYNYTSFFDAFQDIDVE